MNTIFENEVKADMNEVMEEYYNMKKLYNEESGKETTGGTEEEKKEAREHMVRNMKIIEAIERKAKKEGKEGGIMRRRVESHAVDEPRPEVESVYNTGEKHYLSVLKN